MQVKLMAWLVSVAAVFGLLYAAYAYGKHVEHLEMEEKATAGLLAYAERIVLSGVQNDKDQLTINNLSADVKRLRIKIPAVCHEATTHTGGAGRTLSDDMENALAEFTDQVGQLILRCDQLNIDAVRANGG